MKVGSVDVIKGTLDYVNVEIHCLKELDYMMILISSCGTLEKVGEK